MISITLVMRAHPGCADALAALWTELAAETRATEAGCLVFRVSRDIADPEQFTIYEIYEDQAAYDAHHDNKERAARIGPKLAELRQAPVQRIVGALLN